ncbi:hypothetical protein RKZ84_00630, partial [Streptococcus pneumoniae]|nr:hypothetical protein [Streptococcus pneumoniae]
DLCLLLPDLQDSYQELLEKMATYIQMMTGLDGRTLAFGDSDSTETTEILSLSAVVLNKDFYEKKLASASQTKVTTSSARG